jgi:hypothetical protein
VDGAVVYDADRRWPTIMSMAPATHRPAASHLKRGTLAGILTDAGLDVEQLRELL